RADRRRGRERRGGRDEEGGKGVWRQRVMHGATRLKKSKSQGRMVTGRCNEVVEIGRSDRCRAATVRRRMAQCCRAKASAPGALEWTAGRRRPRMAGHR
ncbi:hypothetical protein, partial [Burkholderia ubonensis]|uniref:hypothetical protein n=1 Tax=Burkholderia ubonensis TaxID=101571 RepID=UPI001C434D30